MSSPCRLLWVWCPHRESFHWHQKYWLSLLLLPLRERDHLEMPFSWPILKFNSSNIFVLRSIFARAFRSSSPSSLRLLSESCFLKYCISRELSSRLSELMYSSLIMDFKCLQSNTNVNKLFPGSQLTLAPPPCWGGCPGASSVEDRGAGVQTQAGRVGRRGERRRGRTNRWEWCWSSSRRFSFSCSEPSADNTRPAKLVWVERRHM